MKPQVLTTCPMCNFRSLSAGVCLNCDRGEEFEVKVDVEAIRHRSGGARPKDTEKFENPTEIVGGDSQ